MSLKKEKVKESAKELLSAVTNYWYLDSQSGKKIFSDRVFYRLESWWGKYVGSLGFGANPKKNKAIVPAFLRIYDTLNITNPPASITQLRKWNVPYSIVPREEVIPIIQDIVNSLEQDEAPAVSRNRNIEIQIENEIRTYGGFEIALASNMTKAQMEEFKNVLKLTTDYIKKSPIKIFKKTLATGFFYLGTKEAIKALSGIQDTSPAKSVASYVINKDTIRFYFNYFKNQSALKNAISCIHEFAHKLDFEYLKKNDRQKLSKLELLFLESYTCPQSRIPEIGEALPLNFINLLYNSASIMDADPLAKKFLSSAPVVLTLKHQGNLFFRNRLGEKWGISEENFKKLALRTHCPTLYSTENFTEWFAEVCTMITINAIPPIFKPVADRFLAIINDGADDTIQDRLACLKQGINFRK